MFVDVDYSVVWLHEWFVCTGVNVECYIEKVDYF